MNKKALLKLADHIDEAGDEKFNLGWWGRRHVDGVGYMYDEGGAKTVVDVEHICGSTACVAGFQNSMHNAKVLKKLGVTLRDFEDPETKKLDIPPLVARQLRDLSDQHAAAEDLGLTNEQKRELFVPDKYIPTCWSVSMGDTYLGEYGDLLRNGSPFNPFEAKSQDAAKLLRDLAFGRVDFINDPMNVASTPQG